jgi:hypothetical protein
LLAAPTRRIRRPLHNPAADHDLLWAKLFASQVHLDSGGEPVPVVILGFRALDLNLAEYQLPTEQILDDKCRDAALGLRRVVRTPLVDSGRVTCISTPARAHGSLHIGKTPHGHGVSMAAAADILSRESRTPRMPTESSNAKI